MKTFDLKTYFNEIGHSEYQRENFDAFLKRIGFNYAVPTIHIAGSNGKGSTANYLANIYREHGLKVGLFTSPYLICLNEMININGQDISDEDFIEALKENDKLFKKYSLSPFEIQTYIALTYFHKNKCDIAIVECGMGGEIDATNIFIPVVSVITSISLEHTVYLGRSLCEIAYQKAGIIKEEIPVITGILEDEAINTIVEVAKDKKSQVLVSVEPTNVVYENRGFNFSYLTYKNLRINSSAYYSLKDACIALEVIIKLMDYFRVKEEEIRAGLARTFMPVRMEIIQENPLIVVDGSHNPEGILNMTKSLNDIAENRPVHILFACFKDKNVERMLAYLGEYSTDITLTTFPHNRARKKEDYFLFLDDFNFEENALICLDELKEKYPEDFILITGSLAFASYVKEKIKRG